MGPCVLQSDYMMYHHAGPALEPLELLYVRLSPAKCYRLYLDLKLTKSFFNSLVKGDLAKNNQAKVWTQGKQHLAPKSNKI